MYARICKWITPIAGELWLSLKGGNKRFDYDTYMYKWQ